MVVVVTLEVPARGPDCTVRRTDMKTSIGFSANFSSSSEKLSRDDLSFARARTWMQESVLENARIVLFRMDTR